MYFYRTIYNRRYLKYYKQVILNMSSSVQGNCVFCRVVADRSSEFFYEDDEYISFKDIKPATFHHYLIIPKRHVSNPATLKSSDVGMVKKLLEIAKEILEKQGASTENARFGFHWPPFNTVQHLHLHAISPLNEMSFISRLIFRPDSYWFITASSLIEKLEKMPAD